MPPDQSLIPLPSQRPPLLHPEGVATLSAVATAFAIAFYFSLYALGPLILLAGLLCVYSVNLWRHHRE